MTEAPAPPRSASGDALDSGAAAPPHQARRSRVQHAPNHPLLLVHPVSELEQLSRLLRRPSNLSNPVTDDAPPRKLLQEKDDVHA